MALEVDMRLEQGAARRRVLWRDGALADVRLPGAALGSRRMLPEQADANRLVSWDPATGLGPALRFAAQERKARVELREQSLEIEPAP
jgi:hypothetical protein